MNCENVAVGVKVQRVQCVINVLLVLHLVDK